MAWELGGAGIAGPDVPSPAAFPPGRWWEDGEQGAARGDGVRLE